MYRQGRRRICPRGGAGQRRRQDERTANRVAGLEQLRALSPRIATADTLTQDLFVLPRTRAGLLFGESVKKANASKAAELERFDAGLGREREVIVRTGVGMQHRAGAWAGPVSGSGQAVGGGPN